MYVCGTVGVIAYMALTVSKTVQVPTMTVYVTDML